MRYSTSRWPGHDSRDDDQPRRRRGGPAGSPHGLPPQASTRRPARGYRPTAGQFRAVPGPRRSSHRRGRRLSRGRVRCGRRLLRAGVVAVAEERPELLERWQASGGVMSAVDLATVHLDKGSHRSADEGHCLLEVASMLAGQPFGDGPPCVSPVLRTFGISVNDQWDDEQRQKLLPFAPRLLNTAGDGLDEARSYLALDWLIRTYTPAWLDLAGLTDVAAELRALRRVADMAAAAAAGPVVWDAQTKAAAAGAAAWDAASAAAWDAAGAAAGDAAGAAAWDAAWDAAGAAAGAAARDAAGAAAWDAAWDAAGVAAGVAARDAAWDAAGAAAGDAAWDAAGAAAGDAAG